MTDKFPRSQRRGTYFASSEKQNPAALTRGFSIPSDLQGLKLRCAQLRKEQMERYAAEEVVQLSAVQVAEAEHDCKVQAFENAVNGLMALKPVIEGSLVALGPQTTAAFLTSLHAVNSTLTDFKKSAEKHHSATQHSHETLGALKTTALEEELALSRQQVALLEDEFLRMAKVCQENEEILVWARAYVKVLIAERISWQQRYGINPENFPVGYQSFAARCNAAINRMEHTNLGDPVRPLDSENTIIQRFATRVDDRAARFHERPQHYVAPSEELRLLEALIQKSTDDTVLITEMEQLKKKERRFRENVKLKCKTFTKLLGTLRRSLQLVKSQSAASCSDFTKFIRFHSATTIPDAVQQDHRLMLHIFAERKHRGSNVLQEPSLGASVKNASLALPFDLGLGGSIVITPRNENLQRSLSASAEVKDIPSNQPQLPSLQVVVPSPRLGTMEPLWEKDFSMSTVDDADHLWTPSHHDGESEPLIFEQDPQRHPSDTDKESSLKPKSADTPKKRRSVTRKKHHVNLTPTNSSNPPIELGTTNKSHCGAEVHIVPPQPNAVAVVTLVNGEITIPSALSLPPEVRSIDVKLHGDAEKDNESQQQLPTEEDSKQRRKLEKRNSSKISPKSAAVAKPSTASTPKASPKQHHSSLHGRLPLSPRHVAPPTIEAKIEVPVCMAEEPDATEPLGRTTPSLDVEKPPLECDASPSHYGERPLCHITAYKKQHEAYERLNAKVRKAEKLASHLEGKMQQHQLRTGSASSARRSSIPIVDHNQQQQLLIVDGGSTDGGVVLPLNRTLPSHSGCRTRLSGSEMVGMGGGLTPNPPPQPSRKHNPTPLPSPSTASDVLQCARMFSRPTSSSTTRPHHSKGVPNAQQEQLALEVWGVNVRPGGNVVQ